MDLIKEIVVSNLLLNGLDILAKPVRLFFSSFFG
jgi:hypothetical protein